MASRVSGLGNSLLHDLQIHLLHVNLLTKLGRELGRLQESRIYSGSHGGSFAMAIWYRGFGRRVVEKKLLRKKSDVASTSCLSPMQSAKE